MKGVCSGGGTMGQWDNAFLLGKGDNGTMLYVFCLSYLPFYLMACGVYYSQVKLPKVTAWKRVMLVRRFINNTSHLLSRKTARRVQKRTYNLHFLPTIHCSFPSLSSCSSPTFTFPPSILSLPHSPPFPYIPHKLIHQSLEYMPRTRLLDSHINERGAEAWKDGSAGAEGDRGAGGAAPAGVAEVGPETHAGTGAWGGLWVRDWWNVWEGKGDGISVSGARLCRLVADAGGIRGFSFGGRGVGCAWEVG